MCQTYLIAQLVEHCTGYRRGLGSITFVTAQVALITAMNLKS